MPRPESSPFDPFAFDDGDDRAASPRGIQHGDGHSFTTATSKTTATSCTKNTRRTKSPALDSGGSRRSDSAKPLPPRLNVRLSLHEEVSSMAVANPDGDGGSLSQMSIEGTVTARVESSNAKDNTPFALQITGPMTSMADITCRDHCVLEEGEDIESFLSGTVRCCVDIPKAAVAGCEILRYSLTARTQNMPILVQAKSAIVRSDACRISVQIRSNLSNQGDLSDLLVVVAVPATLLGAGLRVTRGDQGVWDAHRRLITWRVGPLPHGESRLFSAEAGLAPAAAALLHDHPFAPGVVEARLACPVLVRCSAGEDQASDLTLTASALEGVPATIVQQQVRSYQLLHRVSGKNEV